MTAREYDAATGRPTDAMPDPASIAAAAHTFNLLPLAEIVPSRTNPRTTFDEAKLQELAESIRGAGVLQPILVRPLPGSRVQETSEVLRKGVPRPAYEIVSGERRVRACVIAQLATIPAFIRDMTDNQVLEAQLVENLQRDDLHPMEEAEGYRRLCDATGLAKAEIGAKIGKGRTYVYQRLQLLTLEQAARDAYRAGKMDLSKAQLLATVHDPKLQLKALKELTQERYDGETMTVRAFRDYLERNILLDIKHAPFDTKDPLLLVPCPLPALEGTSACTTCPKRTGANRDIFAAFDSADLCTDPRCYGAKATITLQRVKDAAAKQGMTVIAGVEAKKLKPYSYNDDIKGYVRLDTKHGDVEGAPTIGKLLGKDAPAPILFVDPHTHKGVRVLPTEVVGQLLKEKGVPTKGIIAAPAKDHTEERKREYAKREAEAEVKYENEWRAQAGVAIDDAIRAGKIIGFSPKVLRLLCDQLYDNGNIDATPLLPLWGLPLSKRKEEWQRSRDAAEAIERHIKAAPDADLGRMALHLLMLGDLQVEPHDNFISPAIDILASEAGVDLAAIQRAVKTGQKEATRVAKPAPGAKKPAAPQKPDANAKAKAIAKKLAAGEMVKFDRLTAEQAKSSIADAMQGDGATSGEA